MYFLGDCMTTPSGWDCEDTMVQLGLRNGTFLVKSFYSSLHCRRVEPFLHDIVWNSWVPMKVFFAWEATWARILTLD